MQNKTIQVPRIEVFSKFQKKKDQTQQLHDIHTQTESS